MIKQRLSTSPSQESQYPPVTLENSQISHIESVTSEEGDQYAYQYYNSNVSEWLLTVYAYDAQNEGELSFKEGEWVGLLEDYGDGWGRGLHQGTNTEGVFPLNYTQKSEEYQSQGQVDPEAQLQKKREIREKLKEEMKDLKEVQSKQQQRREILEKDIRQLTETSQKLKKELRHLKADLSDKNSLISDLIKLTYAMDYHLDSTIVLSKSTATSEYCESISHFNSEFQKESKNSSGIVPFAQKTCPKLKELSDLVQSYQTQSEESLKLAKEVKPDLEILTKAVETKQPKK